MEVDVPVPDLTSGLTSSSKAVPERTNVLTEDKCETQENQ